MALQGKLFEWDLSKLHPCYSVLHGIAAGYLISIAVVIELKPKMQAIIIGIFLLLYWAVLELIPVPGVGAGTLVLIGGGYGFLMLALSYWIIDVKDIVAGLFSLK